ncbi:MAG: ComF family protein [Thermoanaerobaculum sp.]|nr:ComF family protein [Thermoanaerobaculum sp.]MDW7968147.1 ComF family protein [Thermoanaerobaculum sp.]
MGRMTETLVQALLPARCLLCGTSLPKLARAGVCLSCWNCLPRIPSPTCAACAEPSEQSPCLRCQASPPPWQQCAAVFSYAARARDLVLLLKHGRDELARPCAQELVDKLQELGLADGFTVTFVPTHLWRRLRRGYNQAELLASHVAKEAGLPCRALLRRVTLGSQQGRSRASRTRQVAAAFRPKGPAPASVILVDDVITSGATAMACTRALRHAGARQVVVLALARTLSR